MRRDVLHPWEWLKRHLRYRRSLKTPAPQQTGYWCKHLDYSSVDQEYIYRHSQIARGWNCCPICEANRPEPYDNRI